jgi:pectate lyase
MRTLRNKTAGILLLSCIISTTLWCSGCAGVGKSANTTVTSITVSPAVATPGPTTQVQFTVAIQGAANNSVIWTTSFGTITPAGVFTAPAAGGKGNVTATSVADPSMKATAAVTVTSGQASRAGVTSVTVSPDTAISITNGTLTFKATVNGTTSNTSASWRALLGVITTAGVYTAPNKAGTDTVTAISVADATKSASATVVITAEPSNPIVNSIAVAPSDATTTIAGNFQFAAIVQGTVTDRTVGWSTSLGTIDASGLYTAPTDAGTYTVTATSHADSTKSASVVVLVSLPISQKDSCGGSACPAFPGATGGGASAAGGRGGVVIEVTNLNDSGTGSLRACVETSGPRTCVFRVSGNIASLSRLAVINPFITIAGQTAPGGGIVLGGPRQKGEQLDVQTHDVVVRYLTYDGNSPAPTGPDTGTVGFEMANGGGDVYNVVFDHLSARWAGNKSLILYANDSTGKQHIKNTSWQWILSYEPNVNHPVGPIITAIRDPHEDINNDWHHNMFINVGHRLPLNEIDQWRWVNTISYNWDYFASNQSGTESDFINNLWVYGPQSAGISNPHPVNATLGDGSGSGNCLSNCDVSGTPSIYMKGNDGPQGTDYQLSAEEAGTDPEGFPETTSPIRLAWRRSTPLPTELWPIIPDPVNNLDAVMLATVGNSQHLDCNGGFVSNRDSQDTRVINQYKAKGPGGGFAGPNYKGPSVGPAVSAGTPCQESLHDGIPDQWKSLNGLSITDQNLHKAIASNGYTYLENYLNGSAN